MVPLQLACVAILAAYFVAHRRAPRLLREALLLGLAGLLGENTMILGYGYYGYAPGWSLFVLHVPLLIAAIWPPVVLSARAIARALLRGARPASDAHEPAPLALAALTGALVLFDAALIEPIAVRAGLWSWSAPGVFSVPLIGLLGWGFFAFAAVWCLESLRGAARLGVLLVAPLATHVLLQLAWWGGLRWALRDALPWPLAATATALASLAFTAAVLRRRAFVPWRELLPRAAATGFFAALLARSLDAPLGVYAATFTAPYLALCALASRPALAEEVR